MPTCAPLERIDAIEALGIAAIDAPPAYWRTLGNRLAARCRCLNTPPSGTPGWPGRRCHDRPDHHGQRRRGAASSLAPRARIVLATLAAIGFAALAWAAFVSPLPRLTYNPSDSVAVGWYRVDRSTRAPLAATSVVRGQHRWCRFRPRPPRSLRSAATCRRACRCSNVWRGRAATRLHRRRQVRIDGAFGRRAARRPAGPGAAILQLCRRLEPGELFLLSVTNPASFDSRYFGPVSASAVIGVAHPVWLETRP
jgi:type IV secretory pathway protease TraF